MIGTAVSLVVSLVVELLLRGSKPRRALNSEFACEGDR